MLIIHKSDIEPMTKVFDKMTLTMSNGVYNGSMETLEIDVPKECSIIVLLMNDVAMNFNSTSELQRHCRRARLRIIGTATQGTTFLVQAQKEDNSL
tara:strand:- start:3199 stop:3486 length:288 start_codon:yes stop_codon:yes gene_type:complete